MNRDRPLLLASHDPAFRITLETVLGYTQLPALAAAFSRAAELRSADLAHARLLLDAQLPGADAIDLLRELKARHRGLRIALLSPAERPYATLIAICSGADGLIDKDSSPAALTTLLLRFNAGEAWLSPRCANRLLGLANRPGLPLPFTLQQRRVLRALRSDHRQREDDVMRALDMDAELLRGCLRDIRALLQAPRVATELTAALRNGSLPAPRPWGLHYSEASGSNS